MFTYDDRVAEYFWEGKISGNPQRNFALDLLREKEGYIYFLDDDNKMHPNFWRVALPAMLEGGYDLATFDQVRPEVGLGMVNGVWEGCL